MLSKVSVNKFGAASNAFTLASSMIIREENVDNTLIVLDGDVYTSDDSKRDMIKKVYSGNEEWANDKRNLSLTLIKQFNLPKDEQPEHFLHSLLCENQNSDNEVVEVAKRINGVKDKHEWINQIVKEIDVGSEVVINDIINECSKSNQWDDYVKPVYDWLFERRKI